VHRAHYRGKAQFEWLRDGRRMKLLAGYAFIDATTTKWSVPKGAIIDGASIPRILWSVTGGPYEGRYRNASVVHDWYCDVRTRPWRKVHRMFFEAMLVSGVPSAGARIMYAAVHYAGPRWTEAASVNTVLAMRRGSSGQGQQEQSGQIGGQPPRRSVDPETGMHPDLPRQLVWRPREQVSVAEFVSLVEALDVEVLDADQIDVKFDRLLRGR
jgi:Protein of unknown function (DUF1353)